MSLQSRAGVKCYIASPTARTLISGKSRTDAFFDFLEIGFIAATNVIPSPTFLLVQLLFLPPPGRELMSHSHFNRMRDFHRLRCSCLSPSLLFSAPVSLPPPLSTSSAYLADSGGLPSLLIAPVAMCFAMLDPEAMSATFWSEFLRSSARTCKISERWLQIIVAACWHIGVHKERPIKWGLLPSS